jgi:glycosyltransferase involved in cell wall biosynthesis
MGITISIIAAVYNGEFVARACIKNVLKQNYPDIEHTIVDGGSTDDTVGQHTKDVDASLL